MAIFVHTSLHRLLDVLQFNCTTSPHANTARKNHDYRSKCTRKAEPLLTLPLTPTNYFSLFERRN
jgi:hypothetical protein